MSLDNIYIIKCHQTNLAIRDIFLQETFIFKSFNNFISQDFLINKKIYISTTLYFSSKIISTENKLCNFLKKTDTFVKDSCDSLYINNIDKLSPFDIVKNESIQLEKMSEIELGKILDNEEFLIIKKNFLSNDNNYYFDEYLKLNNIQQGATGSDDFGGVTDPKYSMAEMAKGTTFESKQVKTQTLKYDDGSTKKTSDTIVIKGGDTKQGDTINQMSQTTIGGDLEVNNTERTQRAIQELATF